MNTSDIVESADCHTHILKFKNEYKFIEECWHLNCNIQTTYVPWEYCDTVKVINKNNTMLIFKPDVKPASLHGIKTNFNNLEFQRTQLYGNLYYSKRKNLGNMNYKQLLRYRDSLSN